MTPASFSTCALPFLLLTMTVHAQHHDGDIVLAVESGRIITKSAEHDTLEPARVWATTFGSLDFTDSPGFDSEAGTFAGGSQVGFDVHRALRAWNGSEFPLDMSGIPLETVQIQKSGFGTVVTPMSDMVTPGFGIPVSSSGEFHQHVGFTLTPPRSAGIYLLELTLWSTEPGIGPSEPLWIVFNNDLDADELESAVEWAESHLATRDCPADVNGDTGLDILDFLGYLDSFAPCDGQPAPCVGPSGVEADFNDDGSVDVLDFLDFLGAFGDGCA